jgi:predicted nucleic acid-binding protein
MIYLDTSVVLAHLLAEDRVPRAEMWSEDLVSSRLLEYEVWNRIHARGLLRSHGEDARTLLGGVAMVQMVSPVLVRALEGFPVPVRTLDALHLATIEFMRSQSLRIQLATYDARMLAAAQKLRISVYPL